MERANFEKQFETLRKDIDNLSREKTSVSGEKEVLLQRYANRECALSRNTGSGIRDQMTSEMW